MAFDYHSRRWRRVREKALKLAGYQCQESKRYGVTRQATTVHHIWPTEQYPEYAYCLWNLLALTTENHDAMHDRASRRLTPLGEYWKRRSPPPKSAERSGRPSPAPELRAHTAKKFLREKRPVNSGPAARVGPERARSAARDAPRTRTGFTHGKAQTERPYTTQIVSNSDTERGREDESGGQIQSPA